MSNVTPPAVDETRRGIIYGALAYGSWGVLPLYFRALEPAGAGEILAQRIVWSAVLCLLFWLYRREIRWLVQLARNPRTLLTLSIAAAMLAVNWGLYIYAVSTNNVVESSLGYFINPLILVLLGVAVLGERLSTPQWLAITLGAVAVLVISIDYGRPPWIALTLAVSFSAYGYIKKMLGGGIPALQTMTVESMVLAPFALGALVWMGVRTDDLTFTEHGWMHALMLAGLGIATVLPLTWFTSAATRLPLSTMGLLQYLAPTGQFLIGVFVFQEQVPLARWIGFGLVWVALVLLTTDTLRRTNRNRRARRLVTVAEPK